MVAAGVFLTARFFPVFTPEVLLVIAIVGAVTLFMAGLPFVMAGIIRVLGFIYWLVLGEYDNYPACLGRNRGHVDDTPPPGPVSPRLGTPRRR